MNNEVFRGFSDEVQIGLTKVAAAMASKAEANYVGMPKDGKKCSGCKRFISGGTCKVVKGNISPSGWCKYWSSKEQKATIQRNIRPGAKKEPQEEPKKKENYTGGGSSTKYDRPSAAASFESHGGGNTGPTGK